MCISNGGGAKFREWLKNRLMPAFKKKYPGKKMILVMDNAKYHKERGPEWVTPSSMKKAQLAEVIRQVIDMKKTPRRSITVDKKVFAYNKLSADVQRGGPSKKQLQEVARDMVKSGDIRNTTVPEQLVCEQWKGEIIYTPPYESWLQPIELVWARVKHQVARQSHVDRTRDEVVAQTKEALRNCTAVLCRSLAEHVHRLLNAWLKTTNAGSLNRFADFDALVGASPAERALCTDVRVDGSSIIGTAG